MDSIFILTGAGISAESGLGTFRDKDGLWTSHDLRRVATPEGFRRDPALVHDFYNMRRRNCLEAAPNAAHAALARLQVRHRGEVTLVTQNVDDLHKRAGSPDVIHMHGELLGALCASCGHRWPAPDRMAASDACPACARTAVRPDIVWFGEIPYRMDEILGRLARATLFVVIGSSGEVYPAAGFVEAAAEAGIATLEINLEPSGRIFDRRLIGPATETVPRWVDEIVG
ncbi:NAD-dependent deacylase [Cereibacter sphaeroides]|uniref:NAD-dependent deacylase n=1 Tax=Cereibacter sphaeroides TaxID=1063 RepID=UPI001F2E2F74|nr:NAD-dependent deacylase [Cereibacter sphaeroides]MCE6951471.1 NAD-dependent deacylase [Cereibacter sphaeroides]